VVTINKTQNNKYMTTQLCCAEQGSLCQIMYITGQQRNRLAELGFSTGQIVKVINHHKHGPIDILVRDSHIALREKEAETITVRVISKVPS
jgi:Fe2+ transport system protein FeoA